MVNHSLEQRRADLENADIGGVKSIEEKLLQANHKRSDS